jgi:CheY-like chemotaxis protein
MNVLVVEDDPTNLQLVRYVLELDGHVVESAVDGAQLRARLGGAPADLVLMDIRLPDEDGYALLAAVRAAPGWEGVPVVAVTAEAMVGSEEQMLAAGFREVVTKPIDTRALGQVVLRNRRDPEGD